MTSSGLLLLTFIIAEHNICNGYRIELIEIYPGDPHEGEPVVIECRYPKLNVVVEWSKDGKVITRNSDFLDDEYCNRKDVKIETDYTRSLLSIANGSRLDSGVYICRLYDVKDFIDIPPHVSQRTIDEQSVQLNVLYYPKSEHPSCHIKQGTGQPFVTLVCMSEIGNPFVSLEWSSNNNELNEVNQTTKQENELITSDIMIYPSQLRSTSVYTCSVTSSAFDAVQTCSLNGYSIPSAYIHPIIHSTHHLGSAEFSCNTTGDPIKWFLVTDPEITESRTATFDRTLRIDPVHIEDNGTLISCYVLFGNTWVRSDAILVVDNTTTESDSDSQKIKSQGALIGVLIVMFILLVAFIASNIFWSRKIKAGGLPEGPQERMQYHVNEGLHHVQ